MRILGLIPARGGSKGVPRKNVRKLGGKPLIAYTIDAALRARRIDRVVVSTEDDEIAEVASQLGAELPFRRDRALAEDDTPMLPVMQHAIRSLMQDGWEADAVCLLQPTYPFRTPEQVDGCVAKWASSGADCVMSVHRVPHQFNPHWVYFQNERGELTLATGNPEPIPRRQDLPAAFHRSGSIYVVRASTVIERNSLYGDLVLGYETPNEDGVNIDQPEDWARAEAIACTKTPD
jgi:CMP-N-acetylneuraminic acid synthetase